MYGMIKTGEKAASTVRKVIVANQNRPAVIQTALDAPQWYDVKYMIEHMFDLRANVRDAIEMRRHADAQKLRYANASSRQIIGAEIHGYNLQIALSWNEYREATAKYHQAWKVYQENLRR